LARYLVRAQAHDGEVVVRLIRRLTIVAAAVLVFAAAFVLRDSGGREPGAEADRAAEKPLPRLVDLGSDKCVPCKKMAPILEELAVEHREAFRVEFIDVWKDRRAGKKYGVRVIPTQVFYDASGEERWRHEGFLGKDAILAKWKELGVELGAPAASDPAGAEL
jgi:thioredoxin 1